MTTNIGDDLARRIGLTLPGEEPPEPQTMLDWALHWARCGIHVFPCARCLGSPYVGDWYNQATSGGTAKLVHWWSEWRDADVAGVPCLSGHYVIIAAGATGMNSLLAIEDEFGELPAEFR